VLLTFAKDRGWRWRAAFAAITALVAAGCVGATKSGLPSLSPAATPAASAIASPTATSTSSLAAIDLSTVPLAPSGTWKSIRWVSVPANPLLASPSPTPTPHASGVFTDSSGSRVFGWSRGFVDLSLETSATELAGGGTTTITTTYSSDGVHWHAGVVLQQHQSVDNLDIRGVFEGSAGLLAVEESGACGDSWVEGLLTSRDGVTWQSVDMRKAFGKAVIWNVSGGSTGFVATDTTGHAVWTSHDGQSWQPAKLDTPAFATSRIDDGTAFSAGYVLVGSTELTGARNCGVTVADPSAKPTAAPPLRVPAIWWSSDGANWVKSQLPGAKAEPRIQMSVQRLDDHTLAAFDYHDNAEHAWVSDDGGTWKPLAQPVTLDLFISDYYCQVGGCLKTDGQHGVQLQAVNETVEDAYAGGMSLSTWTEGGLMTLTQSGDQPPYDFGTDWAVGPTGVVVTDAGQLWIGLPSSD
jgi:hypothetical protein